MRRDAAANRQALIDAAVELFNERGLAPTLDDIARAAGVSVATAYRHFSNKTELAFAVLNTSMESMVEAAERAATAPDGWSGLVEFFEATIRKQAGQQALRDLLATDPSSPPMVEVHRRIGASMATLLERAQRQGTVRDDVVVADLAVLGTLLGEAVRIFATPAPESWKRVMPLLLDGLRPGVTTPMGAPPLSMEQFIAGIASQTRPAAGTR
ncbi:TetR family transcriptional regulator [Asanoa ishikariensis]|uniref:Transcriptional regulator, TetR family n=1 Tax=Asanoa ishikariensis TaxID=137265 RepID=A0A1H3KR62_9ACTN|nr:TetR/AcrR family transcriptional regulator [Asanoa ishikariensis]GIF69747.1 TetR family transcriptional regulator [Asanoa ishikariensis]SDY54540.1 transcriptional regulator, TetR family [Asanoa ishikariensis]